MLDGKPDKHYNRVMGKYNKVALGGTFDRLHKGHEALLNKAFLLADKVVIGITVQDFPHRKELTETILTYEVRRSEVAEFVTGAGYGGREELVELRDVFGPTLDDESIDSIVATEQTLSGAKYINNKRVELGKSDLPIEVAELVVDETGEYISSTRIRQGQIDRQGRSFRKVFSETIKINDEQREKLKTPMGKLYKMEEINHINDVIKEAIKVVVVGDISTELFSRNKWRFDMAVFDNKVQKKSVDIVEPLLADGVRMVDVVNAPGTINTQVIEALESWNNNESVAIRVAGEEDLVVLPMLLLLPLRSVIVYGQPGSGVVVLEVTEEAKEEYRDLLVR